MVVRAEAVALLAFALAEEGVLDEVVVPIRLLRLRLRRIPKHLREQVTALRHRARAHVAELAFGILLHKVAVDLAEHLHVVVHERLRLVGIAIEHLDMRLHRNGLAEHEDQLSFPEELVHAQRGRVDVLLALRLRLFVLRVGGDVLGETEEQLHLLQRHRAPAVIGKRL